MIIECYLPTRYDVEHLTWIILSLVCTAESKAGGILSLHFIDVKDEKNYVSSSSYTDSQWHN